MPMIRTVLFDLDGTLIDTAPDMAYALNKTLEQENRSPLPFNIIRNQVSHGSSALIRLGFPDVTSETDHEQLKQRFLDIYQGNLHLDSCLFPGMAAVLAYIENQGMNWGVVTNKPGWLTNPLMESLGLLHRSATTISGDTTDQRKPHPKPMLIACEEAGSNPASCLYIGDAERDISAGKAALMKTLVAKYGYIDEQQNPETWGADGMIEEPRDILEWIGLETSAAHPLAR
jgi:N-acetyl-D-muramate 6-phosphate phosphatase